jgi:hypothetical protein
MTSKEWKAEVEIDESGRDTHVHCVLTTQQGTVEGSGHARRNPADPSVPEIGDELAAGRAFLDLGHRLVTMAGRDIQEEIERTRR